MGLRRTDDAWLAEQMGRPRHAGPRRGRQPAPPGRRCRRVGRLRTTRPRAPGCCSASSDGRGCTSPSRRPPDEAPGERRGVGAAARGCCPRLPTSARTHAPLVFHAIGLAEWHYATRFCPRCGGTLRARSAGHELRCTQCDRAQFPRTDPAVIMADHARRAGSDEAMPARPQRRLAGRVAGRPSPGFCEPGETLEDAVRREVMEEVGVQVGEVAYFGNQPWPLPASLMLGFTGRAVTTDIDVDGAEIEEARWLTRDELRGRWPVGRARRARAASRSRPRSSRTGTARPLDGPAGTDAEASRAQSQVSHTPVAGSAMKHRGHRCDRLVGRGHAGGTRRAGAAGRRGRAYAARTSGCPAPARVGGESSRMSKPRRTRCLLAPAPPPGMSAGVRVRPVARPCAMPAIAAASYSLPWCISTCVETPPRTEHVVGPTRGVPGLHRGEDVVAVDRVQQ